MNPKPHINRLLWRCRRGTRELDIVLSGFIEQHHETLTQDELIQFERLLDVQDPVLNEWLYNGVVPTDQGMSEIVKKILHAD